MKRKSVVLAILAALVSSLMVAGGAQPAIALTDVNTSVEWSQTEPILNTGVTDADASLYRAKCASGGDSDTMTKLLPDGTTRAAANAPTSSPACSSGLIAGRNGQMFAIERTQVSAYDQNGVRLWTTQVGTACPSNPYGAIAPYNAILGKDGNLYVLTGTLTPWSGCSPVQSKLIRIMANGGGVSELATLSGSLEGLMPFMRLKDLRPYKDGVMLVESGLVRFFGYTDGQEIVSKRITGSAREISVAPTSAGSSRQYVAVSYDGAVAYVDRTTAGCAAAMYVSEAGRRNLVSKGCSGQAVPENVAFGPDGSIHVDRLRKIDDYSSEHTYAVYRPSGAEVYTYNVTADVSAEGADSLDPQVERIDVHGNVLWEHSFRVGTEWAFKLKLVNPSGNVIAAFDGRNLPVGSGGRRYMSLQTNGALYVGLRPDEYSPTWTLHKIGVQGMGMDFPRAAMLDGYTPPVSQKLKYVAMGDSFSSGEGNSEFDPWTDQDGVNKCHRSQDYAYPKLLAKDNSLNLDLVNFVACSGATTHSVLNGQWNESAQVGALSSDTKVVTMTIGGNDMGFTEVLNACSYSPMHTSGYGCSSDVTLQNALNDRFAALSGTGMASVGGHPVHSLQSIYAAIHTASPGATIYVGGYPHLFGSDKANFTATNDTNVPGGAFCTVLPGVSFSYEDTQWINARADTLNNTINDAINEAKKDGIDIHYVPPAFGGHSLCDSSPAWLYGVLPGSNVGDVLPGSMHPDVDGQIFGYEITFSSVIHQS